MRLNLVDSITFIGEIDENNLDKTIFKLITHSKNNLLSIINYRKYASIIISTFLQQYVLKGYLYIIDTEDIDNVSINYIRINLGDVQNSRHLEKRFSISDYGLGGMLNFDNNFLLLITISKDKNFPDKGIYYLEFFVLDVSKLINNIINKFISETVLLTNDNLILYKEINVNNLFDNYDIKDIKILGSGYYKFIEIKGSGEVEEKPNTNLYLKIDNKLFGINLLDCIIYNENNNLDINLKRENIQLYLIFNEERLYRSDSSLFSLFRK